MPMMTYLAGKKDFYIDPSLEPVLIAIFAIGIIVLAVGIWKIRKL